jgi:hypothetical protein
VKGTDEPDDCANEAPVVSLQTLFPIYVLQKRFTDGKNSGIGKNFWGKRSMQLYTNK